MLPIAALSPDPAKRWARPQSFRASATGRLRPSISANTSIAPAKRPPNRIVYLVFLTSPVGRREWRRGQGSIGFDDLVADLGSAGVDHADVFGRSLGKIENATLDKW